MSRTMKVIKGLVAVFGFLLISESVAQSRYVNEKFCFSINNPSTRLDADVSPDGAGVKYTLGPDCTKTDQCNTVSVFGDYLTYTVDYDPVKELVDDFVAKGWAFHKQKITSHHKQHWQEVKLIKQPGQREVMIVGFTSKHTIPAIAYRIISESSQENRKEMHKTIQNIVDGWQNSDPCQ